MTKQDTRMIPLALILDPDFNSRTDRTGDAGEEQARKYAELLASMADPKIGQLQAIEVEEISSGEHAGKFLRVIGSRRVRAARELKWENIRAEVKPQTSILDRMLRNIEENLEREELTPYEQARALNALREAGMSGADAAKKLHRSESQLKNLVVGLTLPPVLLKEWEECNPALTQDFVRDLARGKVNLPNDKPAKSPEEKIVAFQLRAKELEAAKEAGKGRAPARAGKSKAKGAGGGGGGLPVSQKRLQQAIDFVKSKKSPERLAIDGSHKKWSRVLLDWIVQQRESAPAEIQAQIDMAEAAKAADEEAA